MKSDNNEYSTVERRRIILEELEKNKQVKMTDLFRLFNVSKVTLRKDLQYLESKNLLIRSRGGAMLPVKMADDLSVKQRMVLNLKQKKAIATAAISMIGEGDTIIIDSGTTLMQLACLLDKVQNLTVITNAIDIALKLSEFDHLKIIIPGGIFRKNSFSLVGVFAVDNFSMFRADRYFVSADGINEDGVFTSNLEEGQLAKLIMSNAKENVLLVDSSKFDRMGIINYSSLEKFHTLITDKDLPKKYHKILNEQGIRVVIADSIV
ncbi:MAG TPA: DeoR/GlpR family DNA-binding transcription regulator [Draconibacterium sp.]|nr:DeoR/GlpR family DNA-binding transcription regulator [Draconibacterium sp.]